MTGEVLVSEDGEIKIGREARVECSYLRKVLVWRLINFHELGHQIVKSHWPKLKNHCKRSRYKRSIHTNLHFSQFFNSILTFFFKY